MSQHGIYLTDGPKAGQWIKWSNPAAVICFPVPLPPPTAILAEGFLGDPFIQMQTDTYESLGYEVMLYKYRGRY